MTIIDAEREADRLYTRGPAVGVVRWRRRRTPRFWVGVCFTDGRRPGCELLNGPDVFAVSVRASEVS